MARSNSTMHEVGDLRKNVSSWLRRRDSLQAIKRRYYRRYDQISNDTRQDRYPEVFAHASELLSYRPSDKLRLLSFGCSTGEECFSLRRYFPSARIDGVDINRKNIRACKERNQDSRIRFDQSERNLLKSCPGYDAVFAMSVLCRWPQTELVDNSADVYPFSRFDETVRRLDPLIRPNGLLIICNANFRFSDTATSEHYKALRVPGLTNCGFVHLFSSDNRKLRDQNYPYCVFKKLAHARMP
jgi:2-polyprenyl-3-methyl-5-hydroxy-6-metoxy-1,4-benzoquinol methylase